MTTSPWLIYCWWIFLLLQVYICTSYPIFVIHTSFSGILSDIRARINCLNNFFFYFPSTFVLIIQTYVYGAFLLSVKCMYKRRIGTNICRHLRLRTMLKLWWTRKSWTCSMRIVFLLMPKIICCCRIVPIKYIMLAYC